MNSKTYTPQQLYAATRVMDAISSVPSDKRLEFIRLIEAIAISAEVAVGATRPQANAGA